MKPLPVTRLTLQLRLRLRKGTGCCGRAAGWRRLGRDVITVVGPDAALFLQGQLTQDVAGLAPGSSAWSLILAPAGKVDALVRVWRVDAESFVLDTDAGWAPRWCLA